MRSSKSILYSRHLVEHVFPDSLRTSRDEFYLYRFGETCRSSEPAAWNGRGSRNSVARSHKSGSVIAPVNWFKGGAPLQVRPNAAAMRDAVGGVRSPVRFAPSNVLVRHFKDAERAYRSAIGIVMRQSLRLWRHECLLLPTFSIFNPWILSR